MFVIESLFEICSTYLVSFFYEDKSFIVFSTCRDGSLTRFDIDHWKHAIDNNIFNWRRTHILPLFKVSTIQRQGFVGETVMAVYCSLEVCKNIYSVNVSISLEIYKCTNYFEKLTKFCIKVSALIKFSVSTFTIFCMNVSQHSTYRVFQNYW